MKVWQIVNAKTDMTRGIPFEKMLDACQDIKDLPPFSYVIQRRMLKSGMAYVPALGESPAFAT